MVGFQANQENLLPVFASCVDFSSTRGKSRGLQQSEIDYELSIRTHVPLVPADILDTLGPPVTVLPNGQYYFIMTIL